MQPAEGGSHPVVNELVASSLVSEASTSEASFSEASLAEASTSEATSTLSESNPVAAAKSQLAALLVMLSDSGGCE